MLLSFEIPNERELLGVHSTNRGNVSTTFNLYTQIHFSQVRDYYLYILTQNIMELQLKHQQQEILFDLLLFIFI